MSGLVERPASPLSGHRLCDGLTSFYESAVSQGPITALDVLQPDDAGAIVLTQADAIGRSGRPAGGLSEDAKDRLLSYHWPGNVRELRNAIERAVILAEGGLITSDHLPIAVGQSRPAAPAAAPVPATGEAASLLPPGLKLETLERDPLHKAMVQAKNNKSQAAKLLGVPRGQFYSLLKRHGLTDAKR
jgi:DNA-binding NtrC family response regulator